MTNRVPFRGLHLFGVDAPDSPDNVVLQIPLAPEQGEPRVYVYLTRANYQNLHTLARCLAPCCAKPVQSALDLGASADADRAIRLTGLEPERAPIAGALARGVAA